MARLDLTSKENMLLFECGEADESKLVKLETRRTVILPPTVSGLCWEYIYFFTAVAVSDCVRWRTRVRLAVFVLRSNCESWPLPFPGFEASSKEIRSSPPSPLRRCRGWCRSSGGSRCSWSRCEAQDFAACNLRFNRDPLSLNIIIIFERDKVETTEVILSNEIKFVLVDVAKTLSRVFKCLTAQGWQEKVGFW